MIALRIVYATAALVLVFVSQSASSAERRLGLISNGGSMRSFEEARNTVLRTDAEYGSFVDPQVSGAERQFAIYLLKLMPPPMRGDFVYVDPNHHILSNRIALGAGIRFEVRRHGVRPLQSGKMVQSRLLLSHAFHRYAYPPTGFPGGSGIRTYSVQGINAALGYATPPCDVNLVGYAPTGDAGDMYFNAYPPDGSGSVVDAGISANSTNSIPKSSVTPFINPDPGGGTWSNQNYSWPCGRPLGIMYGTLPPNPPYAPLSMMAVGIPDYDPTQMQLPPASSAWSHAAWNFFNTDSRLLSGPGTWNGIPSNCMGCSVGRMLTIAQSVPQFDGSCYGGCAFNTPDARWDQVVMGELIAPCSQVQYQSATCTIEYLSSGLWQAGRNTSLDGEVTSEFNDQNGFEGINLNGTFTSSTNQYAQGKFSNTLPIAPASACSPDSLGYCSNEASSQYTSNSCYVGTVNGRPKYLYGSRTIYNVFQGSAPSELLGRPTDTKTYTSTEFGCSYSYSWAPYEPRVQFNDPNLP